MGIVCVCRVSGNGGCMMIKGIKRKLLLSLSISRPPLSLSQRVVVFGMFIIDHHVLL